MGRLLSPRGIPFPRYIPVSLSLTGGSQVRIPNGACTLGTLAEGGGRAMSPGKSSLRQVVVWMGSGGGAGAREEKKLRGNEGMLFAHNLWWENGPGAATTQ